MTTAINHRTNPTGVPPVPPEAHPRICGLGEPNFSELLARALHEPGIVSKAYSRFHRYSLSNQMLAALQLTQRDLPLSPIASFKHWQTLGRNVKKGEKALGLLMPVPIKKRKPDEETGQQVETEEVFTLIKLAHRWFSLEQTEGREYVEPLVIPEWDAVQALEKLGIVEEQFAMVNGNVQGYARTRQIAVSPIAEYPHKTRFHELAHVVLGHTAEQECCDASALPRHLQEAEAEGTAFILCALLGLPGLEESRGYVQSWLDGEDFPEKSSRRVFTAAQSILDAGRSVN